MNESGEYGPIPTDVHRQIQNKVHVAAKVVDGQWASVAHAHIQSPPAKARVLSAPTLGQPCTCEGILSTSLTPMNDRVRDAVTVSPQEAVSLANVVQLQRGVLGNKKHRLRRGPANFMRLPCNDG